jgi:hypothetical protein
MTTRRILRSIPVVVVLAAVFVPSAMAFLPAEGAGVNTPPTGPSGRSAPPMTIPYLSHGVGIDLLQYGGTGVDGSAATAPSTTIPYLSHGVGIDLRQFGGTAVQPVQTAGGSGFNWGDAGAGAGGMLAFCLLASLGAVRAQRGRGPSVAIS